MSDAIFDLALKRIREAQIEQVMLSPNLGEPLLAPQFLEKLKKLRAAGVSKIEVTTNALFLHKIGVRAMLDAGPDKINISFAGFNQSQKGNKFMASRRSSPGIPACAPEMEEVAQLANDIEMMTEVDDWLHLITEEILPEGYTLQKESTRINKRPCVLLWDLTVHPDGDIHLCACRNINGDPDLRIGNIKEMTLLEAHAKIEEVLVRWESGNIPLMCKSCSMYGDPAIGLIGRWREIRLQGN